MYNIIKKIICLCLSFSIIIPIVACSQIDSNKSSDELKSSAVSTSSLEESNSSISIDESVSEHVHSFNQKITNSEYLKASATYFKSGEYYYACSCGQKGQATYTVGVPLDYKTDEIDSYINMLITDGSYSNPIWNTEKPGSATWNYIDGCMMTSFLKLYNLTNDQTFYDFVENYLNYVVKDDGTMRSYSMSTYNLDNINEGRVLFDLYETTEKNKYLTAITTLNQQLNGQPRESVHGCFWHKQVYPNQIWLDGIYMAQPFRAIYAQKLGDNDFTDILKHFTVAETYMKDSVTGLYYHGLDTSKKMNWANKATGLSSNYWLRAMGWYFAALSDMTAILPKGSSEWKTIQNYLKQAVDDVLPYLHKEKYMFYQVVDKGDAYDSKGRQNYLETSGTALICYAILNGVNTGALDASYHSVGKAIFNGICTEKLQIKNGKFTLTGICQVAGLSSDRNGSFEYYLSEKVVDNEAKGVAPFIMAYVEILRWQALNN